MIPRKATLCMLVAFSACGAQPVVDDEPLPPTAIRWLEQALLSKHAEIRSKAFASYERHWPQLRESVANAFRAENAAARHAAAWLFSRLGSAHDAPLLRIGLQDPAATVRIAAARALGRLGDTRSASRLIDIACTDVALEERLAMLHAAARLEPDRANGICRRLAKARDWRGRRVAAQVMGTFADDDTHRALHALLADEVWMVAADAAAALADRGDQSIRPQLLELLKSEHAGARVTATKSLQVLSAAAPAKEAP